MALENRSPTLATPGSEKRDHAGGLIDVSPNIADPENQRQASHCAYVDALQVWLKQPLSPKKLQWLSNECGNSLLGGEFKRDEPLRYMPEYCQGLRLTQPSHAALTLLSKRDDILLTYAELAFDYILNEEAKHVLAQTFSDHFIQRWHRNKRSQLFANDNGRTGKRGKRGSAWQWYHTNPSKLTGEVDTTFHLEIWVQGSATMRRQGIDGIGDLLTLDYPTLLHRHLDNAFWTVDRERLGRFEANKRNGTRRRQPNIIQTGWCPFNLDRLLGNTLWRIHSALPDYGYPSIQQFVDCYGRGPFLTPLYSCANNEVSNDPDPTHLKHYHLSLYLQSIDTVTLDFPIRPRGSDNV